MTPDTTPPCSDRAQEWARLNVLHDRYMAGSLSLAEKDEFFRLHDKLVVKWGKDAAQAVAAVITARLAEKPDQRREPPNENPT